MPAILAHFSHPASLDSLTETEITIHLFPNIKSANNSWSILSINVLSNPLCTDTVGRFVRNNEGNDCFLVLTTQLWGILQVESTTCDLN